MTDGEAHTAHEHHDHEHEHVDYPGAVRRYRADKDEAYRLSPRSPVPEADRATFPGIPYFEVANTGDPTGSGKLVLVAPAVDTFRLPALALLDTGLRRALHLGGTGVTLAVDAFNVLNASPRLQAERNVELAAFDRTRELLRPRILRLGIEVAF